MAPFLVYTMNEIQFTAVLAGKPRDIVIMKVSGGNGVWHLMIDNYYYGKFAYTERGWEFHPQKPEKFTPETVEMLLEKMREVVP